MKSRPERSNIDQLRKQAKELLRDYRCNEPAALERFRSSLPAARGKDDASLIAMELELHDAQSCIAREYGFESWTELKARVEWQQASTKDLAAVRLHWLQLVYGGPTAGGSSFFGRPVLAAKLLAERPELARGDAYLACAVGDDAVVRAAIAADPAWVNRNGGVLNIPPLVAVTHSTLGRLETLSLACVAVCDCYWPSVRIRISRSAIASRRHRLSNPMRRSHCRRFTVRSAICTMCR